ncbi:MAG: DVUA0089 family protein [Cyanobacteria bacterium J06600_6]
MSVESNNTIQNANDSGVSSETERSTVLNGAIDFGNDVDLYLFQADEGEKVILDLDANESGSALDGRLRLFDSSGNEIGNNDDRPAPGEVSSLDPFLSFTASSSDNYYVGVSDVSNSDYDPNVISDEASIQVVIGEYSLEISLVDLAETRTTIDPDLDPDGTIANATSLELINPEDKVILDDLIDTDVDLDLYQVELEAGEVLTIDIDTQAESDLDSRLRLFNAVGNELASSDDDAAPGEEELSLDPFLAFTASIAGDYYVGVSEFSNSDYDPVDGVEGDAAVDIAGEYTLEGSISGEKPEEPTPAEPAIEQNNTIASAIATGLDDVGLTTFSNAIEPIADVDLYEVQLDAGQGLILDIDAAELLPPSESVSGLDSLLRLFDAEGNQIAIADDVPAPGEEFSLDSFLSFAASSSGKYYVGVSSLINADYDPITGDGADLETGNTGEYNLDIEIVEVVAIDTDPDNTIPEAIATGLNSGESKIFSQAIEPETDADLYQVQLEAGDNLLLDLDANQLGSDLDARLRLFDAAGNELLSVDDAAAPGEEFSLDPFLTFTAESAGDYYIGVSDFNNAQYDLNQGITNLSQPVGSTTGSYELKIKIATDDFFVPIFASFDRVIGTDNSDILFGNAESTFIDALGGDDIATGASNDDYFVGGAGNDILSGNNGDDTLIGGSGFDFLSGGEGNDLLRGDEDSNILFGGSGADIFAIAEQGNNTIVDFESGIDQLQLLGNLSFADLTFEDVAGGSGVVISSDSSAGITTVLAISSDSLSTADFI